MKESNWYATNSRSKKREKTNRFCGVCMNRHCCDGLVRGRKAFKRSKQTLNADKHRYFDTLGWAVAAHPYGMARVLKEEYVE